jgi:phospholipase/lecithinase/hemolysin
LGPVIASSAGGNDFAYGGAQTTGTGGFNGAFIKDLDEQVDQYLASRTIDSHALYEVFTGANDFINGQTNVSVPAGVIAAQINRLIAAGATQFFVPNLPLLGDTPEFNGNVSTKAQYNLLTTQFNAALATTLDSLQIQNPALTFFRLDVASLFQEVINNPAQFGLTNVTASAAPGLTPGTLFYNKSKIVPNPNQYVFWDDVHPTATVHAILAQDALHLLTLPGDFNHDGIVDAADYIVWRDAFGQRGLGLQADGDGDGVVDATDYDIWRKYYGDASGSLPAASTAVPEPATLVLSIAAGFVFVSCTQGSKLRRSSAAT